jgi:hypothetical protein
VPLNITDDKLQQLQDAPEEARTKFFNSLQQDERDQLYSAVSDWKTRRSQPAEPRPKTSAGHAALIGFGQGATANFADEIGGLVGKALIPEGVHANLDPQDGDSPQVLAAKERMRAEGPAKSSYELVRDGMREDAHRAAEDHSVVYTGANIGGEVTKDAVLSRLGVPVNSPIYAGVSGALSGVGSADDATPGGSFGGAAIGAAAGVGGHYLGAGIGAVAKKVGPMIVDALPEAVQEFAAKQALKASGYIQKDIKPLARRDPEQLVQRGQELLREGTVRPFRSVEDVAEGAEGAVQKYGDAIGQTLKAADSTGAKFDMRPFVQRARQEILDPIKNDPAMASEAAKLGALLDDYEKMPLGSVGFEQANQMKGNLQQQINWGNRWNDAKGVPHNDNLIKMQGIFLDEVDNQLGDAFSQMGQPGQVIRNAFKEVKRRYGIHADSLDKARMGVARDVGNAFVSTKDAIAGTGLSGALAMAGHPMLATLGMGGALASKFARERGSSTLAVGANQLGQVLERFGSAKSVQWLAKVPAQAIAPYVGPITAAAARGAESLSATLYVLSQRDPQFRQMKQQAETSGHQGDQELP